MTDEESTKLRSKEVIVKQPTVREMDRSTKREDTETFTGAYRHFGEKK